MELHHLALRSRDVARCTAFYRDVLGLTETRRQEDSAGVRSVWLAAGAVVLMVERAEAHEPSVPSGSLEMVAFAIDEGAREAWRARLAAAAVAIEAETQFTLYFRDPDGRRVAVSSYRFA